MSTVSNKAKTGVLGYIGGGSFVTSGENANSLAIEVAWFTQCADSLRRHLKGQGGLAVMSPLPRQISSSREIVASRPL